MRRLTLSSIKTEAGKVLGVCPTNTDGLATIVSRLNEAQERLLNRPDAPVGGLMRYRVCLGSSACITWPRQIRTIEAYWLCNTPGMVVSQWHEAVGYNEGGYGLLDSDGLDGRVLVDHGFACSFDNIISSPASPRKIQFVAADASDNGKTVHVRYIDSNGQRKYSSIAGTIQEGENLTLSTSGVLTSSNVATGGLYHITKATTNYPVRAYSYNSTALTQVALIGLYEPSETEPVYRRTLIPGLTEVGGCSGSSSDCTVNKTVTILARVQHVPVVVDNDPFVLTNAPALLDMAKSIQMRRDNFLPEADNWEARATRELDGEMSAYLGSAVKLMPRMPDWDVWGGAVYNPA